MNRVYLQDCAALAWLQQSATPAFWDAHWQIDDLRSYLAAATGDEVFLPAVREHLPPGSVVLEGGCGRGHLVHALRVNDYRAIGVDFAERTITAIHQAMPTLEVHVGDVRALPVADNVLDGYISVGVIEHFWHGYAPILTEMHRTLRPGGVLFLSFPYLSPLRRWKVQMKRYPLAMHAAYADAPADFYQFALSVERIVSELTRHGFQMIEQYAFDGIKGVKDEVAWLKPLLQPVYDGKHGQRWRSVLDRVFRQFGAHSVLLVMKKR